MDKKTSIVGFFKGLGFDVTPTPKYFYNGAILRFGPGYHMKTPYYAEVIHVDQDSITTSIPGGHTVKISFNDDYQWNYHMKRITIVGPKNKFGFHLYNQALVVNGKRYLSHSQLIAKSC